MWKIKSITERKYSCEQALMKGYALYLSRDYQMILSDSWGFEYSYDSDIIGGKISPGYRNTRYYNYEKFHGIKMVDKTMRSIDELDMFAQTQICKSPIIIDFDTYLCHWNPLYKKRNFFHRIFIVDCINQKQYMCIDHYVKEPVLLDLSMLTEWKGRATTFECSKENTIEITRFDYINELKMHLKHLNDGNMLAKLDKFFFDLRESSSFTYGERTNENPRESILLINLNRIINQRLCFKEYLEYLVCLKVLGKKDMQFINLFDNMAAKYNSLKMIVAKEIMQRKKCDKSILIEEILKIETLALKTFSDVCMKL